MSRMKPYTRLAHGAAGEASGRSWPCSALIFSWMWGLGPLQALAEAPARIFRNIFINPAVGLPVGLTIALSTLGGLVYIVFFFGIFFIGGVETFKPGEIKTRFRDIWGQDHVVRRVRRTSTSWSGRRRSKSRAATCRAASCCGAHPAPARR